MPDSRFHLVDDKGEHIRPVQLYSLDGDGNPVAASGDTGLPVQLVDSDGSPIGDAANYANVTATATVKAGAGVLEAIVVNNPGTTITCTIYDNTSAAGTKIGTIALVAAMNLQYGCGVAFGTGLHIVLSGVADVTVVYR